MNVAAVLYLKWVPGRCTTAWVKNDFAEMTSGAVGGSSLMAGGHHQ